METNEHPVPMSTSPEGVTSRRAYFDRHDVIPKFIRGRRVGTMPRNGSLTDYTGPWTPQYLLSLDGGGIKGYSSLWILKRLMKHIDAEEKRLGRDKDQPRFTEELPQPQPPFEPCFYFDYVFGTSTGGLIAIMLGRLRMSVDESLDAYRELAGRVFAQPRWFSLFGLARDMYDHHELRKAINEVVMKQRDRSLPTNKPGMRDPDGDEVQEYVNDQPDEPRIDGVQKAFGGVLNVGPTFNSDPTMCRTVCVAYASIEDSKESPFLFRSYEHIRNDHTWHLQPSSFNSASLSDDTNEDNWWIFERNPGPAHALPIWQVARATTAATGYFKPMTIGDIDFVDGALGCNNPAQEAYDEVVRMHNGNRAAVRLLLSIGTGQSEVTRIGRGQIGRMLQAVKAGVGVLTETEETHNTMTKRAADIETLTYRRFNVPKALGVGQMRMDVWNPAVQQRIETLTTEYLDKPAAHKGALKEDERLQELAAMLVKARRERAQTGRWPISTSQVRYRCTVDKCDNGQKVRNTFDELWTHIAQEHATMDRPLPSRQHASELQRETVERIILSGQIVH
ncbi:hypothetical protein MMC15_000572 [Xylographa vitiligo]|nr:hypothetical protein [Xylographa vitiligo]